MRTCICGCERFGYGTAMLTPPASFVVGGQRVGAPEPRAVNLLYCEDCGLCFLQFDTDEDFEPFRDRDEEATSSDGRK